MDLMKEKGLEDVIVIAGGIIPPEDIPALKKIGIKEIFGPGASLEKIVNYIKGCVEKGRE
jgi:methylmalonyl-CoA mutase C-terminal domain/subunit